MIKEFWQERKEEKQRLKELKKDNRLNKPKTSLWNKICVVCFVMLIVLGPFVVSFGSGDSKTEFSWDKIIGITDEVKESLSKDVNRTALITTREINSSDDLRLEQELTDVGLGGLLSEESTDGEGDIELTDDLVLDSYMLGALLNDLLEEIYSGDVEICELIIYEEEGHKMLKSLMYINLGTITLSDNLPFVYFITTSRLTTHAGELVSLDEEIIVNDLTQEESEQIIDVLDGSNFRTVAHYTNNLIVGQVNLFAQIIDARIDISTINMKFIKK